MKNTNLIKVETFWSCVNVVLNIIQCLGIIHIWKCSENRICFWTVTKVNFSTIWVENFLPCNRWWKQIQCPECVYIEYIKRTDNVKPNVHITNRPFWQSVRKWYKVLKLSTGSKIKQRSCRVNMSLKFTLSYSVIKKTTLALF
jgi:hypothetical protein